jgi:hypothetical protein
MDAEQQRQWDAWVTAHIRKHLAERLGDFAALMGKEVGIIENRVRSDLKAEIDALAKLIGEMRAELKVLRSERSAEIIGLPPWSSARHAA